MNIPTGRLRSGFNRRPWKDSREENITYEESEKVFQSLTLILQFGLNMIVPIVLCMMFGIWLGRKYDILWITIPLFVIGALAGFTNIYKMAKRFMD